MQQKNNTIAAGSPGQKVDVNDASLYKPVEKTKAQAAAIKRARQIERWHKILAPKLPHIDPHDLDLILASLLSSRKERMQIMFLKRREDGRYVF